MGVKLSTTTFQTKEHDIHTHQKTIQLSGNDAEVKPQTEISNQVSYRCTNANKRNPNHVLI